MSIYNTKISGKLCICQYVYENINFPFPMQREYHFQIETIKEENLFKVLNTCQFCIS